VQPAQPGASQPEKAAASDAPETSDAAPAPDGQAGEAPAGEPEAKQPEASGAVEITAPERKEEPAAASVETQETAVASEAPTEEAAPAEDAEKKEERAFEFSPGVQVFLRGEGRFNPDFDANGGAAHRGAVLERVRLQALAKWGPLSGFAQVQDARSWGFEASTASNDANTDLHQGWLELGGTQSDLSGYMRLGRQEIKIGNQRLIGPLAWMPNARSFDSVRLHGAFGKFSLDLFAVMLKPPAVVSTPAMDPMDPPLTATSNGGQFGGGLFTAKVHDAFNAEVLGMFIREDAKDGALAFDRRIGNAGARVFGKPVAGLSYDVEGNVQTGRFNAREHFAWAWAAKVAYMHAGKKPKVKPGGHVGYAMASGEPCSNDPADMIGCGATKSTEFFNFYPTNHIHYGLVDLFGWRNMRDLEAGLAIGLPPILKKIGVTYHFFQLNVPDGRWSNAGGANVGMGWGPDNTDRNLGHEIDAIAVIKIWKPLFIQPGYGVFIPVDAGRLIGGPDAQHFAWLWIVADFF
jgi:hypothetical protein